MRCQERNDLERREATGVGKAIEKRSDILLREGNQALLGGESDVRTTGEEFEDGCAWALGETDCGGELNEIAGCDVVG